MKITITLEPLAGSDLQTFSLFRDDDNLPFAFNVTRAELEAGQTYTVPDGTLQIRVTPDGVCDDSVIEDIVYIIAPEILSISIDNQTQTTAEATGDLVSAGTVPGGVTARGIVWGVGSFPTLNNNLILDPSTVLGSFVGVITGLTAGSPYNFRAFTTTAQGTFYGANISFNTTGAVLPTVSTQAVTDISQETATGNGTLVDPGSQVLLEQGIVWSTSPNPTIADFSAVGPLSTPFAVPMSGLNPNTQYYVKAYAAVNTGTAYGNEVSFTTLQVVGVPPTIVTGSVQMVMYDSATVEGNVLQEGTEPVTEKGIVWATTPNPEIGQAGVTKVPGVISTGAGSYVSNLIGLNPLTVPPTQFYARAYAISTVDTVYGSDVNFQYTPICTPFSGTADEIPVFALPPQVQNVVAEAGSTHSNTLISWDVSTDPDVFAYILERNSGGGSYSEITTQTGTSFIDGTTSVGVFYCYRVKAQNFDGISADWSVPFTACYTPLQIGTASLAQIDQATACAETATGQTFYTANAATPQTGDTLYTDYAATTVLGDGWYKNGVNNYFEITGGAGVVASNGNCPVPLTSVLLSTQNTSAGNACGDAVDTTFWFDGSDNGRPDIGDLIYTSTPANGNAALDGYYQTQDGGVIRIVGGAVTERGGCFLLMTIGAVGNTQQDACDNQTPFTAAYTDGTNIDQPQIGDTLYEDDGGVIPIGSGYYAANDGTIFRSTSGGNIIDSGLPCIPS